MHSLEPFRALILCIRFSMRIRRLKTHPLPPLPSHPLYPQMLLENERHYFFERSVDRADRKCPQEKVVVVFLPKPPFAAPLIDSSHSPDLPTPPPGEPSQCGDQCQCACTVTCQLGSEGTALKAPQNPKGSP